ncbi:MAG: hypothetical protein IPI66_07305 [Chitinophagaceae bacterium]|nr:hypothetical protein [Chitinophagaceae bacterium]
MKKEVGMIFYKGRVLMLPLILNNSGILESRAVNRLNAPWFIPPPYGILPRWYGRYRALPLIIFLSLSSGDFWKTAFLMLTLFNQFIQGGLSFFRFEIGGIADALKLGGYQQTVWPCLQRHQIRHLQTDEKWMT